MLCKRFKYLRLLEFGHNQRSAFFVAKTLEFRLFEGESEPELEVGPSFFANCKAINFTNPFFVFFGISTGF